MVSLYKEAGFSPLDSAKFARECWEMFTKACISLNKKGRYPMVLMLKDLDMSKVLTYTNKDQDGQL